MARNRDNSILKGLLRYGLDEDDEFMNLEEAYDEQHRDEPQHYSKCRSSGPQIVDIEED